MTSRFNKLLAIDYSTQATGWAYFCDGVLVEYGVLTLGVKKIYKVYPFGALRKMEEMGRLIKEVVDRFEPDHIVIEEINRGTGRLQQKVLNAGHFLALSVLKEYEGSLSYMDSNGKTGWRPTLDLELTDADKAVNKQIRNQNRRRKKGVGKAPVIGWKTLSVRWVIQNYGLPLCLEIDPGTDGDIADAISLGHAFILQNPK